MKKIFILVLLISASLIQAEEKSNLYSIDAGKSVDGINIYRLGLQKEFSGWLKNKGIPFSGYFESSFNYWKNSGDEIYGIAFSPVFVLPLCGNCKNSPYIEAGVGLSLISSNDSYRAV